MLAMPFALTTSVRHVLSRRRARAALLGALAGSWMATTALAAPTIQTSRSAPGAMPMIRVTPTAGARAERALQGVNGEAPGREIRPPSSLNDLSAWLEYRSRGRLVALPAEARVFYRRGLMLHASGGPEEALRLVRGAAELDPGYVAPHLTLASWFFFREPGQALQQYAAVLELMRQSFALQLAFFANLLYLVVQSLFLGLLAAGLALLAIHHSKLRHGWQERLVRFVSPETAAWWAWALLVLPFCAGFGTALPTTVLLGLLWPHFKLRERLLWGALATGLVAVPWITAGLDRLSTPMREDRAPFYGVPLLQNRPDAAGQRERIQGLTAREPGNPYLQFAAGWLARRDGDLTEAEAAYRRTLELSPQDDRTLNNLGNTLAAEGRVDEALACYRQATAANSSNAAAHFNAAQIHTLRFDYHEATDALSRASALNFDLVRTYQSQAGDDGWLPLVDQWIAPPTCWRTLSRITVDPGTARTLPPLWRTRIEVSGWAFSVLALILCVLAVTTGSGLQRRIPLRACSNCGRTVCRRCAERRRERALCPRCAAIDSRAESPEFARVLLLQHRRRVFRRHSLIRTAFATLLPGYGLLAFRHVVAAVLMLAVFAALAAAALGQATPFASEPRLLLPSADIPTPVLVGLWVVLYVLSLGGYLAQESRERDRVALLAAPVRSRSAQPTHTTQVAA